MNEAGSNPAKQTQKRKRCGLSTSDAHGDYTSIRIPIPPASAINKDRPISSLIQAQLLHIQHAESARLPKEKRDGRRSKTSTPKPKPQPTSPRLPSFFTRKAERNPGESRAISRGIQQIEDMCEN
jgi:hypothetical protein